MNWHFWQRWWFFTHKGPAAISDWKEALFIACENDDARLVTQAMRNGADPAPFLPSAEGARDAPWQALSAWAVAIEFGSWQAVEALLDAGANVHEPVLYPYHVAWAGKSGKSWSNRVPLLCLAVARLAAQSQNQFTWSDNDVVASTASLDRLNRMIERFLAHGADGSVTYDLVINDGRDVVLPAFPRRPIDHLAMSHPLALSHLDPVLLQRLGLLEPRPRSPLHLLVSYTLDPKQRLQGTVALVKAGASPYAWDENGRSALHLLAQTMDPGFFMTLMDRLPHLVLHGHPDVFGVSALETLRQAVTIETDSDAEQLAMVDYLARRSMDQAQAPLREALDSLDEDSDVPRERVVRRRL